MQEIFKVELKGQKPVFFLQEETALKYLKNILTCEKLGGSIQYNINKIIIDSRNAAEVTPLFPFHQAVKLYEAECTTLNPSEEPQIKVREYADLIPEERDMTDFSYVHVEEWLNRGARAIVVSTISLNHAIGKAKELAFNKLKELTNDSK